MRYLVLFFIVVPLAELYLLLWVSQFIGFWPTVGITVVTGVIGGTLAKREGLKVLRQWNQALSELRSPEIGLVEAALVLLGGALLITPGVMTDLFGFSLLLPFTRRRLATWVKARVGHYIDVRSVGVSSFQGRMDDFRSGGFDEDPPDFSSPRRPSGVIDTSGEGRDE